MKNGRIFKRLAWFLIMLMAFSNITVFAQNTDTENIRYSNGFIQYMVDKDDGRFIICTDEGTPYRDTDSDKKLLFDKYNDPETSFTSFIIDGKEYIFGNNYGFMNMSSSFIQKPKNVGNVNTAIWKINDIEIKQIISLEDDVDHPNVGNVKIRYEIDNKSNSSKKIGSRILLDTMLGDNDGAAFVLGDDSGKLVKNETVLMGEEIPSYWRASDDLFAPTVVSYGFTKGWGNPAPDKMIMAHWGNLSQTKWSYNINSSLDFTDTNNELGTADSAVALYWNEKSINSGDKIVIETYYGLGDLKNYNSNSPYKAKVIAPKTLTVNQAKDGYAEDEITVSAEIDNSLSDSEILTNVKAKILTKPEGFELTDGEEIEKTIPLVDKGEIKTISWKLKPLPQNNYISEPIKVEFVSDNNIEPYSQLAYVLMPSIQGTPPEIQILSTSPNKIYFEGDKYFSIQGSGFDYFINKDLWKMYLVDELGNEYLVPKESINVASDSKMNISILADQIQDSMTTGLYSIKIEHIDLDEPMVIPNDKRIEVTNDETYRSRTYGVLYVEKRLKNDKYYYFINTTGTKEELDNLKTYVREYKQAPDDYESSQEENEKGYLVDIIFDIVGDVKEVVDEETGGNKYIIDTDQTEATINSVIQFKDAEKPIEIKKIQGLFNSEWISLKGKGTLQLVKYGEIWHQSFETYISDGENYVVDEVIEEDDDDKDDDEEEEEEKDSYLGNHDEMEIDPNSSEEDKSNVQISLFDPFTIVTAGAALFIDGFELELQDIIMLDEGASLGGKLAVEIPIGKKKETPKTDSTSGQPESKTTEEKVDAEIGEAMKNMFMTQDEKDEEEAEEKAKEADKAAKAKIKRNSQIRALIINDDEIGPKIISLLKGNEPTSTKIENAIKLIPQSVELIGKISKIMKNEKDDDEDNGKVGIAIDVKKVIFGKKYGEDFIYDDVRYIGTEGQGKVNIELPGFDVGGKEKEQGISAELAINTLTGEYSLKADVNIKVAEAHAFITIMRFKDDEPGAEDKYLLDDLVLSGGYVPGIPIAPPVFISEIGGGAEDLYGVITGDEQAPPMKVVIILGLNVVPAFQGDFTLKVSKNGFTLDGALSIKKIEFLKQARVEVQWVKPVYLALSAKLEAFDILEGEASIYVGQIKLENDEDSYKFFFEGKAKADIKIPKTVKLIGGTKLGGIEVGVSTEKIWGKVKIGFVPLGITWKYGEGIKFGQTVDGKKYMYASLTNVALPKEYWTFYEMQGKDGDMTMEVGDNVSIIGSSKNKSQYMMASLDNDNIPHPSVIASLDDKIHRFNFQGKEIGLIELAFDGSVPNLTVTDPEGDIYPLISLDDDPVNGNYRVQIISADDSDSGKEEKYAYIAIENPGNNYWTVTSDVEVESTAMTVKIPPELNDITMEKTSNNKLNINWEASYAEDSLVSLFLVKEDEPESAGYAIASNLNGASGDVGVQVDIPEVLEEGNYKLRATIQNPTFGYETKISNNYITIVDNNKPAKVSDLKLEPYGNGFIKATWNPLEEDGDISYFATVYDSNGNNLEDFTDYEVTDNSIVLGGEYKDKTTGKTIKLDTNKEYSIGITAKKVIKKEDGTETIHIGEEALSSKVFLKTPQPPVITTTFKNNPIVIESENSVTGENTPKLYFNSSTVEMDFETDQENVNTTVYLDGEYFVDFSKKDFNLNFDLADGAHKVEFKCENSYKNNSSKTVNFTVDTTAPQLLIDYPKPGFISDNEMIDIRGTAESGSTVTINNIEVPLDSGNVFTYEYPLDKNKLKTGIEIKAKDNIGNTTTYTTEVSNGMVKSIKNIYIKSNVQEMLSGTEAEFKAIGVDDTGTEIELDSKNVQWSLLEGNVLADINNQGILTANEAGDVVLKASYYISKDYSYEDALEVNVIDNIESIYKSPNISSVKVGYEVNFALYETTKYDISYVDNSIVNWEITNGNEFAQIDEFGHFKALKEGKATVRSSYTDRFGNYQELSFEINIVRDNSYYDDSSNNDSNINKAIENIWKKLIENEGNLSIKGIENIKAEEDRDLSVRGIVEVKIPKGALKSDDQMFIGTLNNPEVLINEKDYTLHGDVVELQLKEAEGHLNKPIKVIFKYRPSDNINIDNLGVFYYNPRFENWEPIEGTVDATNGTISVELKHLSKYAVLEKNKEVPKVMPDKQWMVRFNDNLDEKTINDESIMIMDSEGNSKPVTLQYNDEEKTIKIIPKENYEGNKVYYLLINNRLLSKHHGGINKELKYMFQVADCGLEGKEIIYNKDVSPNKQLIIKFSKPINEQGLSDKIYVIDEEKNRVPITFSLNASKDEITVIPKNNYTEGEKYYLFIENLTSKNNEQLSEKAWMQFKVTSLNK